MMLELDNGYPLEKPPLRVYYDGACFFFSQTTDDEEIVFSAASALHLVRWLRKPDRSERLDIEGGHFPGISQQEPMAAIFFKDPSRIYPTIYFEQAGRQVAFDADEAPFLAGIIEGASYDLKQALPEKKGKHVDLAPSPVRPQDVALKCPRCGASHGRLLDLPFGQNEMRCPCGFEWTFRYTPDMTE